MSCIGGFSVMHRISMRELIDNLRKETVTTLRVLYALKQFRLFLTKQEDVNKINKNPYFWQIFEVSVRTNLFIGIRRLYEVKSGTFNFQKFIEKCIENIEDFSKKSLRARKLKASANSSDWIDSYMENKYEPTEHDFKALSKIVRNNSKKMKGIYTEAANKIYAHAIHLDKVSMADFSENLEFDEIEAALLSIWHCYEQVWQMYENGRKPEYEIGVYPYKQEVYESLIKQLGESN